MPDDQPLVAVLAAGLARRFGGGKLDADLCGKPLGQWALDAVAAAGLEPGVIVVGPETPAFAKTAQRWRLLVNEAPAAGLGTSVALAVRHAEAQARDLLLLLADMPLLDPAHLQNLVRSPANAATAHPDGRLGVPALICRKDLGQFRDLGGERGAGPLLAGLDALESLDPPLAMLADVDSPEDLARVAQLLLQRSA
jgi:molybdenum cofactor cytidylyltransferase